MQNMKRFESMDAYAASGYRVPVKIRLPKVDLVRILCCNAF